MDLLRSEAFGTQERHDEVDAEGDGDGEAEEGFNHRNPSKPVERAGIKGQHEEGAAAKRDEDEVGHVRFSC
ncbi:hypothetical protein [Neorhizobium huautlense]|uniref:hypothetical protein n=1 Tax=Neorhizobium huautlense TaxID=67774 RepID=UPI001FDF14F7|nr:hypothetical protein [Neorhizobium huautlense]